MNFKSISQVLSILPAPLIVLCFLFISKPGLMVFVFTFILLGTLFSWITFKLARTGKRKTIWMIISIIYSIPFALAVLYLGGGILLIVTAGGFGQ